MLGLTNSKCNTSLNNPVRTTFRCCQLLTCAECRLEEDAVASKLLVNATAQACGLGRISHADLGLRQSEHVQVGLMT